MKLKFRAELKDIIMFIILCLALLYLVAIGVLNINSFTSTGTFSGLNPFPAFTSRFLLITLTFYIITVVASVLASSSHFFEMEKGIGVTTKKKEEKGYSRWMTEKEMKSAYDVKKISLTDDNYEYAGVPLVINGKEAWVDNGENHSLIVGASGSGKTQCIMHSIIKILGKKGESLIVMDPKGELYEESAELLREKGYKIILLNFRDPYEGQAWNPFTLPYKLYNEGKKDKAMELLEDLGNNILRDPKNPDSPFWEESSASYFAGLSIALFEDAPEEEVNINSINYMATIGEEKVFGPKTYLQEYFGMKGEMSNAYISVSATINAPADTKGGIVSTFRSKTKIFSSREPLSEMLSYSDFDLRDIGKEKTALFIKIHDEKTTYHALATVLIKQLYESLIDVAGKQEGLKLKYRTNFILDEFANMPALKDIESMITASRSRNIRFAFAIQNFSQLTKVYGKDVAETIKGNCGNFIFLITTELAALEEISKLCGEIKPPKAKEGKPQEPIRPLVTISDLQQMKKFEVLVKRFRNQPFKSKFTPNFQINWGKTIPKATYPHRESKSVPVFDIKAFVNKKREEQGLGVPGMGMPGMGGGFPPQFNPFMGGMNDNSPLGSIFPNKTDNNNSRPVSNFDLDELIKLVDSQLNEVDEAEKKKETEAKITEINEEPKEKFSEIESLEEDNKEEKIEKPKINVDVDSIIVDDNVKDDEFFDDFFGEDD